MKCHTCGQKASLHMPQHRLALCKEHFLEWLPAQTARFIQKYAMFTPQDRILVAVSGGKDSLALWDVLWRLGYDVDGLYIDLGIAGDVEYSARSKEFVVEFAAQRGLVLRVFDLRETYGMTIAELSFRSQRGRGKPCAVCGLSKRHILDQVALENGYSVLATGHNLDDEAAVLFANTLEWKVDALARQRPVLPENSDLPRKVKPFCRFYERETAAYALLRDIPYIYEECPFAGGNQTNAYKETLNRLEVTRPGAKLAFYLNFLKNRERLWGKADLDEGLVDLHPCPVCGQPTTNQTKCAFCAMLRADN
ncbi:MAG TPA: ATP-binding protein [Anaerolineaceae bacterium]|nr:ATP-binding protein [Anaerolineaceae bacterium]